MRGPHPEDHEQFAAGLEPTLRQAVADYSWLLGRGYARKAGLTLVGDRFQLTQRQRVAVGRCACSDAARDRRGRSEVALGRADALELDGLNVLTTVEAALAGGVLLFARDGCVRDMAAFHGNYRIAEQVDQAARLIGATLEGRAARWWLDRPVSNTGRLAVLLREVAAAEGWDWQVELVGDPDAALRVVEGVVATSDSGILDKVGCWANLTREVVCRHVPSAWTLHLT